MESILFVDRITIRQSILDIGQEPPRLPESISFKLDPYAIATESDRCWALEQVQLTHVVRACGTLNDPFKQLALSTGQLQLFQLASLPIPHRYSQPRIKIAVLDEVTSFLDPISEELVQRLIAEHLADCTILTVAHRLQTIMHCNRIAVLGHRRLLENDMPAALLSSPDSAFRQLYSE